MKSILNILILVILFTSFLFAQNLFKIKSHSNRFNFDKVAQINNSSALDSIILAKMEQYHIPGLAACIVEEDQVIWQGYYGYANIEENKEVNDSTVFLIASISKLFPATALMQLWEKGLFEVDDDINDYLPDNLYIVNPNYADIPITFRMLLCHSSSIDHDSYLINQNILSWGTDCSVALDSFVVNYFMPDGSYYWMGPFLNISPGSEYHYSSQAIGLIGYLVEVLADTSFSGYCKKYIFEPLQMKNTAWFLSEVNHELLATAYMNNAAMQQWGRPDYPANTLRTTVLELANFLIANIQKGKFKEGRILNSATVDSMTTAQIEADDHYVGLGWNISDVKYFFSGVEGPLYYGHNGDFFGFKAGMWYNSENKRGTIGLTNGGDSFDGAANIWWEIDKYAQLTGVEDVTATMLTEFALHQNYPNPFNPVTMINYQLPITSAVELSIYNLLGQKVATLVNERKRAGHHQVEWDATNMASGIYLYRLEAGNYVETKKMILMR